MFRKHPLLTVGALLVAGVIGSVGAYAPLWFARLDDGRTAAPLFAVLVCPGGLGLGLSVLAAFWTGQTVWRIVQQQGRESESGRWLLAAFAASIFASAAGSLVLGVAWLALAVPG